MSSGSPTDGVYEHISNRFAAKTIHEHPQDRISSASRRRSGARRSIRGLQPLTRAQPPTLQASSVSLTPIGCGAWPSPGFM
jgi:hypothetical protein